MAIKHTILATVLFVAIVSLPVEIRGKSNGLDSFYKDTQIFYKCKGQETAAERYTKKKLTLVTGCVTSLLKGKYCQYKCMAEKMDWLDSDGEPNFAKVEKDVKDEDFFGEESDSVIRAAKHCATNNKYVSSANKCHNVREFYYCFYNKYVEICESKNADTKDIDHPSAEAGTVDTGLAAAGTAARNLPVANKLDIGGLVS